ncbi:MAG: SGNH/GDSL hydrolase family protein [Chloroflexi bacterium]|nr:SGNH/GDSL hydrolase family protein [Chloroflexota bacterium]
MGRIVVFALSLIVLAVVGGAVFLGYNFYVAYRALQNPGAAPSAPTVRVDGREVAVLTAISPEKLPEAIKEAEAKLNTEVAGKQAFALELTGTDLMALLSAQAGERASTLPLRNIRLEIGAQKIGFSADVQGSVPVPVAGALTPSVEAGKLKLQLSEVRVSQLPIPAEQLLGQALDQALDTNEALAASGALALQEVQLEDGALRLIGLQREGALIEQDVARRIKEQASKAPGAAPAAPTIPGADLVPPGSSTSKPGDTLYLALGDSLTVGVGVQDRRQGYVARLHGYVEKQLGQPLGLTNLAVSGESTASMLNAGQLKRALGLIAQLKTDGNPATTVKLLTLGIGANDLLGHLSSAQCQAEPAGAACQARLQAGLRAFPANFRALTAQLAEALEPSTQVLVMNAYNPFDLGIGLPAERQANETLKALNAAIAAEAQARGWPVADAAAAIGNKAGALTGILEGDVHPKALGYQAIAYAFTQVYRKP